MTSRAWSLALLAAMMSGTAFGGGPAPVVAGVQADVQPLMEKHLAGALKTTMGELALGRRVVAQCKAPVYLRSTSSPWGAMADLEASGLRVAAAARGGVASLARVLDALSAAAGKPVGKAQPLAKGKLATLADHLAHIERVLGRAKALRDEAIARLPKGADKFMAAWPAQMLRSYRPQLRVNKQTQPILQNDHAFCVMGSSVCQWDKMLGAARLLASLAEPGFLASLQEAAADARPIGGQIKGVTGNLVLRKNTPHGLILIGGTGSNTYELTEPVALIIDLGGNDRYKGRIGASGDAAHPNSAVIDVAGNDEYDGGRLGLATGKLGVGLLVDLAGNDVYKLGEGSGGAGFGGIGVLCDVQGDDTYTGSKFTQGVAIAGIGLLLDLAGNDKYTSFGCAIGYAGSGGVAAVVDVAGDDRYQCGHKYPSGYNGPKLKPGDPGFQYTAFGMGMGQGRRIYPPDAKAAKFALAGGVGMLIDLAGNDRYDSSNFSQGCGYFFGVGLKLDLAGNDVHGAARYGHASGAHFGMGLFIDYDGADTYTSAGPTYNGGCAWDHSAFLCIDAGRQGDVYQWERSAGLGRADIGSWGVFADLDGDDRYATGSGLGRTTRKATAVFFDKGGKEDYTGVRSPGKREPADGVAHTNGAGGLFVDR